MKPSSRPIHHFSGFSLIEMIGVISILAIIVSVVGPNLMRKVLDTTNTREGKNLEVLADGLKRYVQTAQTVPGGNSWLTNVASTLGLSDTEVRYADSANPVTSARVFFVDPAFSPSTGTDPVFSLPSSGSTAPSSARIMIVSSTKRGLTLPVVSGKALNTAGNRAAFDNVWNWTLNPFTKAPPTGWPVAWLGNGEHLHVQRINLAGEFFRVTVSNSNFPTNIPFAKFNQNTTYPFDITNATDAYYLRGTAIRLYRHDEPYVTVPANPDELNITHVLQADINFLYDGSPARWRVP